MSIAIPNKLTFLIFDLKKKNFCVELGKKSSQPINHSGEIPPIIHQNLVLFCSTRMDFLILFLHASTRDNRRRATFAFCPLSIGSESADTVGTHDSRYNPRAAVECRPNDCVQFSHLSLSAHTKSFFILFHAGFFFPT
jgi:hypothetical protein